VEVVIEAEPFWSTFGRVRRRPPVYAAAAIVMATTAWSLNDPTILWFAVALAALAAAAILRSPGLETFVTYSIDVVALTAGILFIGLEPTSAMALWSAIVVVAFFGLPRAQARMMLCLVLVAVGVTFVGADRWSLLELSASSRFRVSIALTLIGLAYLATAIPSLASTTRAVLRAADEAAETQRLQAEFRAHLASMVAHELRNPLAGVRGFVDVLATEGANLTESEREEYLAIVASQTASLEGIVEDLLVAVQDENDRLSVDEVSFDAVPLIERVVQEFGPGSSESVSIDAPVSAVAVGDPQRVAQIVRNLLSNAKKYGGRRIDVKCSTEPSTVRIAVSDDGGGIAPEDVARMFERFEGTARGAGGYGLGLPISRQLAQAMGGDLVYESGSGATFVLTLRRAERI
jgi:signal transduction histidine kinase